eukprot:1526837-Rhodomonas_salina.1
MRGVRCAGREGTREERERRRGGRERGRKERGEGEGRGREGGREREWGVGGRTSSSAQPMQIWAMLKKAVLKYLCAHTPRLS